MKWQSEFICVYCVFLMSPLLSPSVSSPDLWTTVLVQFVLNWRGKKQKKLTKRQIFGTKVNTTSINKDWDGNATKPSYKYIYNKYSVYIHIYMYVYHTESSTDKKRRCIRQDDGQRCKNVKLQSCILLLLLYIHVLHLPLHKCIYVLKTIYMFIKKRYL